MYVITKCGKHFQLNLRYFVIVFLLFELQAFTKSFYLHDLKHNSYLFAMLSMKKTHRPQAGHL